jgi:hypothetical protein
VVGDTDGESNCDGPPIADAELIRLPQSAKRKASCNGLITVNDVLTNERDNAALVSFHLKGSRKGRQVDMMGTT